MYVVINSIFLYPDLVDPTCFGWLYLIFCFSNLWLKMTWWIQNFLVYSNLWYRDDLGDPSFSVYSNWYFVSLISDDLVDPGFVSDHDTDLNQTRNPCKLNKTTKPKGIPPSDVERKPLSVPPDEEEESLMEFPFTFSPLASVLSPLPPSPQSYRKVREVNKNQSTESTLFWWLCLVLFTWIYFLMPKLIND